MAEMLSTSRLAARLGVASSTISSWRNRSRPGGTYADRPFPEPDVQIENAAAWSEDRLPEIEAWMAARPGMGVGGGRPRKG